MAIPFRVAHQRTFSNPADYNAFCVVRVPNAQVAELGGRGSWVAISNSTGKTAYRTVRGSGAIQPFPGDAIEFDYDTAQYLGITRSVANANGFYPCDLSVRPIKWFEIVLAHWRQPDPAYRVPIQLALVGLLLGAVGLTLGIFGLLK
jgi:hypothetical protein